MYEPLQQQLESNTFVCVLHHQVQRNDDEYKTYALKCLKKHHIVETKQEEHIMNEKRIMTESSCDFIVKYVLKWVDLSRINVS